MNSALIEKSQIKKLCLLAGEGELPLMLARNAVKESVDLTIFALCKKNLKELEAIAKTYYFSPLEVYKMINKANELGIHYGTFIGKVPKSLLFSNLHKLDKKLLAKLLELKNLNDDSIHHHLLDFIEKENGFKIVDQTLYLKELFPSEQVFTQRHPSNEEIEEAHYGLKMAKGIAALDIGQTVVVQNKSVIAVEAIEGTNECIKRAKRLAPKNLFVCKVSKPNQDQRFDIPTVGINTVKSMPKDSILVIEAKEVFFPSQEESIRIANSKNICVFSLRHCEEDKVRRSNP